ncbi:MAG TPA: cell division topological specificity factor MinE [Azospirillaceae bacterium]|nr:cell division topological specificity factor MinE [Azospirillaceae bacterium]
MSIFNFFRSPKKTSAEQAKERLQIVMAHARVGRSTGPDFLPMLQQELLAVIAKYVDLDQNKVEVKLDKGEDCSTLEVNIELPVPGEGTAKVVPVKPVAKPEARPEAKPGEPAKAAAKPDDKKEAKADDKKAEAKADVKPEAKMGAAGRA